MKLTEKSVAEFVRAVRAPDPTPGGGSTAALAGALGSALLSMVAAMPKHRASLEDEVDRLREAGERCSEASERLVALVDEDSACYDRVLAAYRLPKGSREEQEVRSARIQAALRGAIDTPLAVMRACVDAAGSARFVAGYGYSNAASDVGVAIELLPAALRSAQLNVEINLQSVRDTAYAESVREEVEALTTALDAAVDAARALLADSA